MIKVKNVEYIKALGKRIIQLRKEIGMTQEELCLNSEVSISQVTRIERGVINPSVSTLYAISQGLGIEMKELFDFKFKIKSKNS